ncbi:MAG: pyroglutamyl-peptidase I [Hyphomicrobium sp.]
MTTSRGSIVLTGFGPFPGVDSNATSDLILELTEAARTRFAGHEVIGEVLPVDWRQAPKALKRLLAGAGAVLALHFGVSDGAKGFQIELVGRNLRGARPDASGELPNGDTVIATGPAMLASTLPAERILTRLTRGGYPCCTSNDAGNYLCNALMYHSLAAARVQQTPFMSGFVHVPASLQRWNCPPGEAAAGHVGNCALTWTAAVAGSIEIIAACLERATLL